MPPRYAAGLAKNFVPMEVKMLCNCSADDIKALREKTGWGLLECKRHFERKGLLEAVDKATSVDELKAILRCLIDATHPKREI